MAGYKSIAQRLAEGLLRRTQYPGLLENAATGDLIPNPEVAGRLTKDEARILRERIRGTILPESRGAEVPLSRRPRFAPETRPILPTRTDPRERLGFAGIREPSDPGLFPIRRPRVSADPQDVGAVRVGSRRPPDTTPVKRLTPFPDPERTTRPALRVPYRNIRVLDDLDPKERKRILKNVREIEKQLEGQEGYLYAHFLARASTAEEFENVWKVTQRAASERRRAGIGSISGPGTRGSGYVGSNFDAGEMAAIRDAAIDSVKRLNLVGEKGFPVERMLARVEDGGLGLTPQQVQDMGFDLPMDIVDTGRKKVTRKQGSRAVTGIALEVSANKNSVFRGLNDSIANSVKRKDLKSLDEVEAYLIRGREEALIEESLNKLSREAAELLGETFETGVRRVNAATAGGLNAGQYDILLGKVAKARAKLGASKPSSGTLAIVSTLAEGDYTGAKHAMVRKAMREATSRAELYKTSAAAQQALNRTKSLPDDEIAKLRMELNNDALAKMDELEGIEDVTLSQVPTRGVYGEDFGETATERLNRVMSEDTDFRGVVEDPDSMRRQTYRGMTGEYESEFERVSPDWVGGLPIDLGVRRTPRAPKRKPSSAQRRRTAIEGQIRNRREKSMARSPEQIIADGDTRLASEQRARPSTPNQRAWTRQYGQQAIEAVRSIRTLEDADDVYRQMLREKPIIEPWLYRQLAMEWREKYLTFFRTAR